MSSLPDDSIHPHRSKRRPRILLGVTGSVAAVKGPELACQLARDGSDVCVLLTRGGENFWTKAGEYDPQSWEEFNTYLATEQGDWCVDANGVATATTPAALPRGKITIHTADDEWKGWNRLGDPVLHTDLRDWADMAIVAPLSAHSLAKFATGLSDDTLSCCIRAWDFGHGKRWGKPLILAPAMNTAMWEHPLTKAQLNTVKSFWNLERESSNGVIIVEPQSKKLACGEIGTGALASVSDILAATNQSMGRMRAQHKERIRSSLVAFAKKQFDEQNVGTRGIESCTDDTCSHHQPEILAPISPTQYDLIEIVLPKLGLTPDSLLVDLGCGDGRWVIAAADKHQCKCIGYDVDEERLDIATKTIFERNLADNVTVEKRDIFEAVESNALADADVIVTYLFRNAMKRLSKLLRNAIRDGNVKGDATIVSVGFHLPSFVPDWDGESAGVHIYIYRLKG